MHVECYRPGCRMTRLRPISWLPSISMGLTIEQQCGGQLHLVKPWRLEDVLGKPLGRGGWSYSLQTVCYGRSFLRDAVLSRVP